MNKKILSGLVIAASAIIVISFFLPWAQANVSATGVSQELTKSLKGTPFAGKFVGEVNKATAAIGAVGDITIKTRVSGYSIPILVNNKSSKIALSLAEIMFKNVEDLDVKSYAVYLLPILAVLCGFLSIMGLKNKLSVIVMILVGGGISITGLYNLYTVDIQSIAIKITIMNGLWYTMYGFLAIFLIGIAWLVLDRK